MIQLYLMYGSTVTLLNGDIPDFKSALKLIKSDATKELSQYEYSTELSVWEDKRKEIESKFTAEQRDNNYIAIYSVKGQVRAHHYVYFYILLIPKNITFSNQVELFSPYVGKKWDHVFFIDLVAVILLGSVILGVLSLLMGLITSKFFNVDENSNIFFMLTKICLFTLIGTCHLTVFFALLYWFVKLITNLRYNYK